MTKDDIIRLAQEVWDTPNWNEAQTERLERFAALVAAHEREECEKACDAVDSLIGAIESVGMQVGARKVLAKACEDATKIAAAIRSRTLLEVTPAQMAHADAVGSDAVVCPNCHHKIKT